MPVVSDEVRDQGLDWAITTGTRLEICSSDPGLTYASVTGNTLGNKSSYTVGATTDGDVSGRKVTCPQVTDGTVTADGTATHWALHNGTDTVVASGAFSASFGVSSGNTWGTTAAFDIEILDAT